jgi:hypothetical protein
MTTKRNVIKDLKKLSNGGSIEAFKELFDILKTLNDNLLFVQRNQCEQEAYLSLISQELKIDKKEIKARIEEITKQLD